MSKAKSADRNTIRIPWGAWHGDDMLDLSFPSLWEVDISRIFDSPRLEDGNIKAAFQNSFGTRPLKEMASRKRNEDGVIVIISKCSNGFGYHALFGPGMRLSRKPIKRRFLKGKDLIVFAPGINQAEFRSLYWEGYTLADRWNSVISLLENRFPGRCRVSVMPCAPLQLLQCPT